MSVSRKTVIIAVCAVVTTAVAVLGARALSASAAEGGKPPRPVTPVGTGPAAPRVHEQPAPAPTDYWTKERVEQAKPAPMPITDE